LNGNARYVLTISGSIGRFSRKVDFMFTGMKRGIDRITL